jgi:hypothetical protein
MRKIESDYTSDGTGGFLEVFGGNGCNTKEQTAFL